MSSTRISSNTSTAISSHHRKSSNKSNGSTGSTGSTGSSRSNANLNKPLPPIIKYMEHGGAPVRDSKTSIERMSITSSTGATRDSVADSVDLIGSGIAELEGCSPSGRCHGHICATPSRRKSSSAKSTATKARKTRGASVSSSNVHEIEGHDDVTRPPPPPELLRLSQLIDPNDLPIDHCVVGPDGRLLAPEQWLVHPERPLCIRERQESIMAAMSAHSLTASRRSDETARSRSASRSVSSRFVRRNKASPSPAPATILRGTNITTITGGGVGVGEKKAGWWRRCLVCFLTNDW